MPQLPDPTSRPTLRQFGKVFVLNLGNDDSRFTPWFLEDLGVCLAQVRDAPLPRALVTTADGKFFSTGPDLDWIAEHPGEAGVLVKSFQDIRASLLTMNAFTVAAVQGHVFGGGALFALAHDVVLMRADRGYFCLPEIDLPVALTDGMNALISAKLPPATAARAPFTGHRYTGDQAVSSGIALRSVAAEQLVPDALALGGQHSAKDPRTLETMKHRMSREARDRLRHLGADMPTTVPTTYPERNS